MIQTPIHANRFGRNRLKLQCLFRHQAGPPDVTNQERNGGEGMIQDRSVSHSISTFNQEVQHGTNRDYRRIHRRTAGRL